MSQTIIQLQGKTNKSIITLGDLNASLRNGQIKKQNISKDIFKLY